MHDLNGNMSSDGTNDYVHDAVNRLITATVGSTTWTYAYGPLDRRMSKADGTNTIQYLYDNDRAVSEYNGSGTLLRKYIYGPGLDEPIMMIVPGDPNETVYYYHADNQGTIIGLTNDSGAWVEKYAYTLYGKPAAASTVGNPYMYTGRRLDAETGLYYYRARYYDPHLRRFIQTDPIGYAGGMNLYAYVSNSSVNFIDPFGLYSFDDFLLELSDVSAAFGDTISGGGTATIRQMWWAGFNWPDPVNQCSFSYKAGQVYGVGWEIAFAAATMSAGGNSLSNTTSSGVTQASNSAASLGKAGEKAVRAVYNIGDKVKIFINGRNRIPDGLTRAHPKINLDI